MTVKKTIIGMLVILLLTGGFVFWISNRINQIKENAELLEQVPASITQLFVGKSVDDHPYRPQDDDWKGRYLVCDLNADLPYNKRQNEKWGTHRYFPVGNNSPWTSRKSLVHRPT